MKIRPYEIVNYDKNVFTIRGEEGDQAEFISEYQLALLQTAERNHNWAPVIFSDSGISTKSHQKAVVDLWQKMRRAGVIAAPKIKSLEPKAPDFVGLHSLSAALLGILHRPFAIFTPMQIFCLLAVCLLGTILFFPVGANFALGATVFPLALFIAGGYFTIIAALSTRSLLQVAGLRRLGRVVKKYRLSLAGPFIYLNFDRSEFLMVTRRERIWLALVGVLSPFLLTFLFSLFFLAHWVSIASLAVVALFAALTVVVQLCPIYAADGAVLLQMWQNPYQKENGVANELRALIAGRIYFEKKLAPAVLFLLLSAWLYSDILHSYFSVYAQYLQGSSLGSFSRAIANLLLLAPLFLGFSLVLDRWRAGAKKSAKQQAIDLPVAEQLQALEKIPLFISLVEAERSRLFQEMELHRYVDGEAIIQQGDAGDAFFVFVKGKAKTVFTDVSGREHEVGKIRSGDAFGEISLIDSVPRTASIVAQGEAICLSLRKESFERFVGSIGSADRMKQIIRLTSFLRQQPILGRFPATIQMQLIDSLRYETLSSNETIKCDAQTARQFYIVFSGKLKADTGDDYTDSNLGVEDCFGYLQPGQSQMVELSVKAVDGCGVLTMTQEKFHSLVWLTIENSLETLNAD